MTSSLAAMPLDVLTPTLSAPGQVASGLSEQAKRAAIAKTAQSFES